MQQLDISIPITVEGEVILLYMYVVYEYDDIEVGLFLTHFWILEWETKSAKAMII